MKKQETDTLESAVRRHLERYFDVLAARDAQPSCPLYMLILAEIEKPLIEETLRFCGHNQSQAAKVLGLNRNTLRKKMSCYGL